MDKVFGVMALAFVLAASAVAMGGPAAAASPSPASAAADPSDQVVVGFHQGLPTALTLGGTLAEFPILKLGPQGAFAVVAAHDVRLVEAALARDAELGAQVRYVEPNGIKLALGSLVPNDPMYASQSGFDQVHAPEAWGLAGYGASSVTVAVIDSGLAAHEDLGGPRFVGGHDYVHGDATPEDDCGHGTHVTGTLAAGTDNGKGVAGMAQATIIPLKVLGTDAVGSILGGTCPGANADVAQAIYDATDEGVRIISLSLGGGADLTTQLAVQYAVDHGVLVVAASGNEAASGVDYPAAYPGVIAVAALDASLARASFSNWGPEVFVAAPGVDIASTTKDGLYHTDSGTSMAVPQVSGALALAITCKPTATADELKDALRDTAQDLGPAGHDDETGYGLLRVDLLVKRFCPHDTDPEPPTDDDPADPGHGDVSNEQSHAERDGGLWPIASQSIRVEETLTFHVTADPGWSIRLLHGPEGFTFDPSTGTAHWTPRLGQEGTHCDVVFGAANATIANATQGTCIVVFRGSTDVDHDGVQDVADNCPDQPNYDQADRDGNGIGDACQTGYVPRPDPASPSSAAARPALQDTDLDGVSDATDLCPWVADPQQSDLDGDHLGDACDTDADGDGMPERAGPGAFLDNCPLLPNPDQADRDGDGVGDACQGLPGAAPAPSSTARHGSALGAPSGTTAGASQRAGGQACLLGLLGLAAGVAVARSRRR